MAALTKGQSKDFTEVGKVIIEVPWKKIIFNKRQPYIKRDFKSPLLTSNLKIF